jgi:TonB family protein
VRHWILICLASGLLASASASAQTAPQGDALKVAAVRDDVAAPTYAESHDGLAKLVQDLYDAEQSGDPNRSSGVYRSLVIPNHSAWFQTAFGEPEGQRLDAKYSDVLEQSLIVLKKSVRIATQKGQKIVVVRAFQKPEEAPNPLIRALLTAMRSPTTVYGAATNSGPDDRAHTLLGDFVYIDGGFRFLDFDVMRALSTAPEPVRAGNVPKPRLIKQVEPVYPKKAKENGVWGTVKLRILLAKDGNVRKVDLVSGDPLLVQAAIDAVKQWKYAPTLLNGQPIELDAQVNVVFEPKF